MTPEERSRVVEFARDQSPGPGEFVELPEGIVWIRLPIPGSLRHINVWLVPGPRGWFLVDTGMQTDAVRAAWEALETRLPLGSDLESIVVTHHHPDHFGMARWLSDRHGVGVHMTERAQAASADGIGDRAAGPRFASEGFATRLGIELDEDMRKFLHGGMYRLIVSGQPEVTPLTAASIIKGDGCSWEVSLHDGHAPGHACLHEAAGSLMISGDQVLPTISSNVSLYPSNELGDPLGEFLQSLDDLSSLAADTLVLPAHGRPFMALHARLAALRAGHEERLERIRELCRAPRTTSQVTGALFRMEKLDALNRLLATTEALAHLRRLELLAQLTREGEGAGLRWHSA